MIMITFWLPPQSSEKLIIIATATILDVLFLVYFLNKIPDLSTNTPRISIVANNLQRWPLVPSLEMNVINVRTAISAFFLVGW